MIDQNGAAVLSSCAADDHQTQSNAVAAVFQTRFPGIAGEEGTPEFLRNAGAVVLDQWTKALTVANIPLHSRVPFWDGLFHFTYLQNTGAAFSSFQGQQWLFALIFAVFTLLLLVELRKNSMGFRPLERWCIVAIWAGGLGNMIDRVRLGYVVDMIEVEFIRFPVFNVADCFITCGCVLLIAHLVLFNREFWKDEKKK